jgi:REP element-mobilizing transposase RayT
MSHVFVNLLTHFIFSAKERRPQITAVILPELHAYLGGLVRELGGEAYCLGGVSDHAHILASLPPRVGAPKAMNFVKANSSRFVKKKFRLRIFAWQTGYGAFSVSKSNVAPVVKYIQDQEQHHRKISFQDEFEEFLKKHGIEYDKKRIWKQALTILCRLFHRLWSCIRIVPMACAMGY